MNELEQEIIKIIARERGIDRRYIRPDSNFPDLGIDSLQTLEILAALEKRYSIEISEEELKNAVNIREVARLIDDKLTNKK